MSKPFNTHLSRRAFVSGSLAGAAAALTPVIPQAARAAPGLREFSLTAAEGQAALLSAPYPATNIWGYAGTVPGTEIRATQGDRLRITFTNDLPVETTVHWHGVRLPNAMDGVPGVTQEPVPPGNSFIYEFDAVDAGTFWYHPHVSTSQQLARGLYGALIIDEPDPIRVDRDITWMLDDWRLDGDAAVEGGFDAPGDISHAGRLGNIVTVNGIVAESFAVQSGERIRLRLVNTANARIFALNFEGHTPQIIALDGQPVAPHAPDDGLIVLGPSMRADLILDCTGAPGARMVLRDHAYRGNTFDLLQIVYADTPRRAAVPDWPVALPANPVSEPDLAVAARHEVVFSGGMMGRSVERQMGLEVSNSLLGRLRRDGDVWYLNGQAASGRGEDPVLTLTEGQSHIISMVNATAFHHPIHLHGHVFRVVSRNGVAAPRREWLDTILLAPAETAEIALVADNPGDWAFHCHVLEHVSGGMAGIIRVA